MDRMNLSQFLYSAVNAKDDELDYLHLFGKCISNISKTTSQNFQDIWVLHELKDKRDGFFVEFGATNGIDCSNTLLLEKEYGWKGILAEPNPFWHDELFRNRNCYITTKCVYTVTDETISFNAVNSAADLSTIQGYGDTDEHSQIRENHSQISVKTISLLDLLKDFDAPKVIDYLSIDTEGSELDILKQFFTDNTEYQIRCITAEHNNHLIQRFKIKELLEDHGYTRKYTEISRWDDYFVKDIT
jgi:FkbM family methyltransferase